MKFKRIYLFGIGLGLAISLLDILLFLGTRWFIPLLIISVTIAWGHFWFDFFLEGQKQRELEIRFLDFVRNLAGAIKSGMPVPRAITHVSKINYGALTPYVTKLGYQVGWSIPVHKALIFFSNSTRNDVIKRSVSTVIEAEQSGGNMEDVLESITSSLVEIKKIKESRRASIHSQVIQSYVIFFVFLGVMLVIQNLLVPYLLGQEQSDAFTGGLGLGTGPQSSSLVLSVDIKFDSFASFIVTLSRWFVSLRGIFIMLSLIQGFFAGVIVGKLAEGDLTSGLKHSLILMTIAFFIMTLFGT
ncbi:type II secretion system F family protein [Candidatus Woesearchaeota archaeon]|nr:type II secretion system F family protein [Candidatus Woesearchaeota archaeon]